MKAWKSSVLALPVLALAAASAAAQGGSEAASGATAPTPTLKSAKSEKYGSYLTDAQGRALYIFEADKPGKGKGEAQSNCYDACAKAWPPLVAKGKAKATGGAEESLVGTTDRKGGGEQLTYNGWPLYYFVKDKGPGETNGQDVNGFGGEWYLVTPQGKKVETEK